MLVYRLLLLCFCFGQFSIAQQREQSVTFDDTTLEKQQITEDDLKAYKADDDFNYTEVEPEENF